MAEESISERGQAFYRSMERELAEGELRFPTCMELGTRIRRALDDADCSIEQIARVIAVEPLLAAHVVRLANSVMFSRRGAACADVRSAVMRVGLGAIKPMALALIAHQIAHGGNPLIDGLAKRLWWFTIDVAALAWALAEEVPGVTPEEALYAGLVNKIGCFYLLARAEEFPELLADDGELSDLIRYWSPRVSRQVLTALGTPAAIAEAVEDSELFFEGWPPRNLADVLYIAGVSAHSPDPFADLGGISREALCEEAFGRISAKELSALLQRAAARRSEALAALQG